MANSNDLQPCFIASDTLNGYLKKGLHSKTRISIEVVPEHALNDPAFLEEVLNSVNVWKQQVHQICNKVNENFKGSVSSEVSYWSDLETQIKNVKVELDSPVLQLSIQIIKAARRFHVTAGLLTDTGLSDAEQMVKNYCIMLKEFPIQQLKQSHDLKELTIAIDAIFLHINRKLKVCTYPVIRAIALLESVSQSLFEKCINLLDGNLSIKSTYNEFKGIMHNMKDAFRAWDTHVLEFTAIAREFTRKRSERAVVFKIRAAHVILQSRLYKLEKLLSDHEDLERQVLQLRSYKLRGRKFSEEVFNEIYTIMAQSFNRFNDCEILDFSAEGTELFSNSQLQYIKDIRLVELKLKDIVLLELKSGGSFNQKLKFISLFERLFIKDEVTDSVIEIQREIQANIILDLKNLSVSLEADYLNSSTRSLHKLHRIPSSSGLRIWSIAIKNALNRALEIWTFVINYSSSDSSISQSLTDEIKLLLVKSQAFYDASFSTLSLEAGFNSAYLMVIKRSRLKSQFVLTLNLTSKIFSLWEDAFYWLDDFDSESHFTHFQSSYSGAQILTRQSLLSLIRFLYNMAFFDMFSQSFVHIHSIFGNEIGCLQTLIANGMLLKIGISEKEVFSSLLSNGVGAKPPIFLLHNRAAFLEFLQISLATITSLFSKSFKIHYSFLEMNRYAKRIEISDFMSISSLHEATAFGNILRQVFIEEAFKVKLCVIDVIDSLKLVLIDKLRDRILLKLHFLEFKRCKGSSEEILSDSLLNISLIRTGGVVKATPLPSKLKEFIYKGISSELKSFQNYCALLDPVGLTMQKLHPAVARLPKFHIEIKEELCSIIPTIEIFVSDLDLQLSKWIAFGQLSGLNDSMISSLLGSSLLSWANILESAKQLSYTISNDETIHSFALVRIDYSGVKSSMKTDFSHWIKVLGETFFGLVKESTTFLIDSLQNSRKMLEACHFDSKCSCFFKSIVSFLKTSNGFPIWNDRRQILWRCLILLSKFSSRKKEAHAMSRFLDDEMDHLKTLLKSQFLLIEKGKSEYLEVVVANATSWIDSAKDFVSEWLQFKGSFGIEDISNAFVSVNKYSEKFSLLQLEKDEISLVLDYFKVDYLAIPVIDELLDDVSDFKQMLQVLTRYTGELESLSKIEIQSVVFSDLLDKMESFELNLSSAVSSYFSYPVYQVFLDTVVKKRILSAQLKRFLVPSFTGKYWVLLFEKLKVPPLKMDRPLMLADYWSLDAGELLDVSNELIDRSVSEFTIRNALIEIEYRWGSFSLEKGVVDGIGDVIVNLKDFIDFIDEDMITIDGLKIISGSYHLEEEVNHWDLRLNSLHSLQQTLFEIQKKWLIVNGVFKGNTEIMRLIKGSHYQFEQVSERFSGIIQSWCSKETCLIIASTPEFQVLIESIGNDLEEMERSLAIFLSKERTSFPRFFFLSDDDLIELFGKARYPEQLSRFISKMYPGVLEIISDAQGNIFEVKSNDGETVKLYKQVPTTGVAVKDWLESVFEALRATLKILFSEVFLELQDLSINLSAITGQKIIDILMSYPLQIVVLALRMIYTTAVDTSFHSDSPSPLTSFCCFVERIISILVVADVEEMALFSKKKMHLVALLTSFKDVMAKISVLDFALEAPFLWKKQLRYYVGAVNSSSYVSVQCCTSQFEYSFDYLGIPELIIQTEINENLYASMLEAMKCGFGGCPFGPAGCGKTEGIKALGNAIGKYVFTFTCDESLNYATVKRVMEGVALIRAWGCFDEFNRLSDEVMSPVSHILASMQNKIQSDGSSSVDSSDSPFIDSPGIFVTINPGYSGRNDIPLNLKNHFLYFYMGSQNVNTIVASLLFALGFKNSVDLSLIICDAFLQLQLKLSRQSHYDFSLRSIKAVLRYAGDIQHGKIDGISDPGCELEALWFGFILSFQPKLLNEDLGLFFEVGKTFFKTAGCSLGLPERVDNLLRIHLSAKGIEYSDKFRMKLEQLYYLMQSHLGVILVGEPGIGKTVLWMSLSAALEDSISKRIITKVIDAKILNKSTLFGYTDEYTQVWKDGILSMILREIRDQEDRESEYWIVFDSEIDPMWMENFNGVLDDNRTLTLSNGDRLFIPHNCHFLFEVSNLTHATPATVSRCGIIYLNSDCIDIDDRIRTLLFKSKASLIETVSSWVSSSNDVAVARIRASYTELFTIMDNEDFILHLLDFAINESKKANHVMEYSIARCLSTFFSLLTSSLELLCENLMSTGLSKVSRKTLNSLMFQELCRCIVFSVVGDCKIGEMKVFIKQLKVFCLSLSTNESIFNFDWDSVTDVAELDSHKIADITINTEDINCTSTVIPTIESERFKCVLKRSLNSAGLTVLVGPPGSGKTLIISDFLQDLGGIKLVCISFSCATTADSLKKILLCNGSLRYNMGKHELWPSADFNRLVIFCDEINLPKPDQYGYVEALAFLRQAVEQKGFWDLKLGYWIRMKNITFIGSCNSPKDQGRWPFPNRFLWHCNVFFMDYPSDDSLFTIYNSYLTALGIICPVIRDISSTLSKVMVCIYNEVSAIIIQSNEELFGCTPRDLTRLIKAIYQVVEKRENLLVGEFLRIFAYEAVRIFGSKFCKEYERKDCTSIVYRIVYEYLPSGKFGEYNLNPNDTECLSNWFSDSFEWVEFEKTKAFVERRKPQFLEETGIEFYHANLYGISTVLSLSRVLSDSQGHAVITGSNGSGRNNIATFSAWVCGCKIFRLNMSSKYGIEEFDQDLREVTFTAGVKGKKVCLIIDESEISETAFLERMNSLLTSGDIPGLWETEQLKSNISTIIEDSKISSIAVVNGGLNIRELFVSRVLKNLHVLLTLTESTLSSSFASASPALVSRCSVIRMGDIPKDCFTELAKSIIEPIDFFNESNSLLLSDVSNKRSFLLQLVAKVLLEFHFQVSEVSFKAFPEGGGFPGFKIFSELCYAFKYIFLEKKLAIEASMARFSKGATKFISCLAELDHLKASLMHKKELLEQTKTAAAAALRQLIDQQKEAESMKDTVLKKKEVLRFQKQEIADRRAVVERDLELILPEIERSQAAVKSIKKQYLTELRSMSNPPEMVKLVLQGVTAILGENVTDWKSVQSILRREDFINRVLQFDSIVLSDDLLTLLDVKYFSIKEFAFENVDRASKACGPLFLWMSSIVTYSKTIQKYGPLYDEVELLVQLSEEAEHVLAKNSQELEYLQSQIAKFESDYAALVVDTQRMQLEIESVGSRILRNEDLFGELKSEHERWCSEEKSLKHTSCLVLGNSLLASAFITYFGVFNERLREHLCSSWYQVLKQFKIDFSDGLYIPAFLCTSEERSNWKFHGLYADTVSVENMCVYTHSRRYSLIVDPDGKLIEVFKAISSSEILFTRFNDTSFYKRLETALKLGLTIFIEDGENFDPIVLSLLKRNHNQIGLGSVKLGSQEIAVAGNFELILYSRSDSLLSSKVMGLFSVINFSLTTDGLLYRCRNLLVDFENPELNSKRSALSESFGLLEKKSVYLKDELLEMLNENGDDLLSNDGLLETLSRLRIESTSVSEALTGSETFLKQFEMELAKFSLKADVFVSIFRSLQSLASFHPVYEFSISAFLLQASTILKSSEIELQSVHKLSLKCFRFWFCNMIFEYYMPSLLHNHRISFGLHLFYICCAEDGQLIFKTAVDNCLRSLLANGYNDTQGKDFKVCFDSLDSLKGLSSMDLWQDSGKQGELMHMLKSASSSHDYSHWINISSAIVSSFFRCRSFSKDPLVELELFVSTSNALAKPLLYLSIGANDIAVSIEERLLSNNLFYNKIALGPPENNFAAKELIQSAISNGSYVLLQNVHLSSDWIFWFNSNIASIALDKQLRLFMTAQYVNGIPPSLFANAKVICLESSVSLKSQLKWFFSLIPSENYVDSNWLKLNFSLAWVFSIAIQRCRFLPLGWSKAYDFTDGDFLFAASYINSLLSQFNMSNCYTSLVSNCREFLKALSIGSKIDVEDDLKIVDLLVSGTFRYNLFDNDYCLVDSVSELLIADVSSIEGVMAWVDGLPEDTPLNWLYLDHSANSFIGNELFKSMLHFQDHLLH